MFLGFQFLSIVAAAAVATSLQSCPTLRDPIDGSPPGSPVPGILQARTLEWVAISFSNAWKWKVKVKSLSRVRLLREPMDFSAPGSSVHGFSRQEYWSGVPSPSLTNLFPRVFPEVSPSHPGNWCWSGRGSSRPHAWRQMSLHGHEIKTVISNLLPGLQPGLKPEGHWPEKCQVRITLNADHAQTVWTLPVWSVASREVWLTPD